MMNNDFRDVTQEASSATCNIILLPTLLRVFANVRLKRWNAGFFQSIRWNQLVYRTREHLFRVRFKNLDHTISDTATSRYDAGYLSPVPENI